MWPLPSQAPHASIGGPVPVDVLVRVASPNRVISPLSGRSAAFLRIEVLERVRAEGELVALGEVILGDLVTVTPLVDDAAAVELVVRRAELHTLGIAPPDVPFETMPPELAPFATRGSGGVLSYREHLVMHGDRLRLRATVERVKAAGLSGDRIVVRDDLARVRLDEVLVYSEE